MEHWNSLNNDIVESNSVVVFKNKLQKYPLEIHSHNYNEVVLAQSEYKKRHDIFAKIIHMNLAVKFNLLKNTQPHCSYTRKLFGK
jgi:hypothetical protein